MVRMEQHFRPTLTDPGYDVVTENRYFSATDGVEWEELSFSVNGSRFDPKNRPPFPLLQPEKVLSLPLQLRFSDDYRYRLAGTETCRGLDCYVVKFDPVDQSRSLFRGTVWIDRRTLCARPRAGGADAPLGAGRLERRGSALLAGDRRRRPSGVPHDRPVGAPDRHDRRPQPARRAQRGVPRRQGERRPASSEARISARRGDNVMYRDTDKGVAVLRQVRRHSRGERSADDQGQGCGDGGDDRSVVRLSAADFRHQLPELCVSEIRTPSSRCCSAACWRRSTSSGRRCRTRRSTRRSISSALRCRRATGVYDSAGEHPDERVITWPLTTGINLGWQYTAFQKATFQYQFRFDGFHADTTTSDEFRRFRARRPRTGSEARTSTGAAATAWCSTAPGTRGRAGSRGDNPIPRSPIRRSTARSGPTCATAATCRATSFSARSRKCT